MWPCQQIDGFKPSFLWSLTCVHVCDLFMQIQTYTHLSHRRIEQKGAVETTRKSSFYFLSVFLVLLNTPLTDIFVICTYCTYTLIPTHVITIEEDGLPSFSNPGQSLVISYVLTFQVCLITSCAMF